MKKVAALASLLLNLAAAPQAQQPPASPSLGRLFPPIDLGLLESPDRAAWQKPEQIMDVLHVADGSKVADIGAGAGWFTIHLARRVGPNGVVYSRNDKEHEDVFEVGRAPYVGSHPASATSSVAAGVSSISIPRSASRARSRSS